MAATRNLTPPPPSFAVTACAIYVPERFYNFASRSFSKPPLVDDIYTRAGEHDIFPSHVFGGAVGGGIMGSLFRASVAGGGIPGAVMMGIGGMGLGMAEKTFIEWKEEERNRREMEYGGRDGDGGEDRGWGGDQRGRKHYDPKSYR
ncbi:hypothetical protein TrCOL_g13483 [Triparma columacea]|uniref:Uncharacterized protein n=1 Tax=Triparma columacea TaxID=722753 RepID=A0A9W7FY76_9STRA|nr:hypothetical protein TrCOL_g13483 [Triparma columacea]